MTNIRNQVFLRLQFVKGEDYSRGTETSLNIFLKRKDRRHIKPLLYKMWIGIFKHNHVRIKPNPKDMYLKIILNFPSLTENKQFGTLRNDIY